ncbi:MAG: PKD domain-containing protein, partial [bacterium]|nr:PKD domain-containing protein [bacterium]
MHLSHKILFGTVLAAVLIVAPLQQSYAQNNTDSSDNSVAAQISHLLELVASLQAQLAELRGHTTTVTEDPTTSERVCPVLSRTLYLGMQGRDVGELQKFLRSTGDYTYPEITNYFGPATQEAVQRWQGRKGIVSSGNPDTTGFGVVGPQTRSVLCGRSIPVVPPKSVAPTSVTSCSTDQYLICATDGGPCRCIPQDGNRSPIVNSFSGPTTLGVNQTGTWTIDASDPENGTLSYDLDWGDFVSEDSVIGQIYAIASSAFRQSNTFQHSYSRAGTYTVTVTVRDNAGNETRTTSTVRVGAEKPSDNVTFSASPTSGSAPLTTTFRAKLPVAGEYALNFGDNTATLTFSVREGACSDGTDHATCGLSLDAARHTYTSPGTYTATLTDPGGCTLAATAQGCLGPPASLLGSVTITVSGSTIDCNAIPSTLGPESLLWKEKCGQPTGTFSASPTSGSAPLSVTFNYQKVSLLYAEEVTWRIYFGDGSSSAWVGSPVSHTYTSPGTYAARITSTPYGPAGSNFTETTLGTVTITVSGGIDCNAIPSTLGPESLLWKEKCGQVPPSVTVVTPRSGQSFSFGDVIPVSWKTSGIPSDAGMSLQLVVRSTGYAIKSQTVKPGAGSASINTGTFCNGYFSDAIDGDCFSLRNGIDKGKTSYFIRAAIYTPADACFGYCARTPGTPETKILAEDESDTFSIISGQSPGTFSA